MRTPNLRGRGTFLPVLLLAIAAPLSPNSLPRKAKPAATDPAVINLQGYKDVLTRHRGKPVMVNFWATWCEPCRDELPLVNELAGKYRPRGLVVIGVSLDEDAEINLVRRFLARVKPVFPNYRQKPGNNAEFAKGVHPKWSGAIPATFFYDGEGRLLSYLVGEQKRPAFEKGIEELLRSPARATPATPDERRRP